MPDKYQNRYRIPSARLQSWDYSSNAAYFITIVTAKRQHYFGQITKGIMDYSQQGKMAHQFWLEIPDHFSFVYLDEFVVMPNHVHGIIVIDKPGNYNSDLVKNNGDDAATADTTAAGSFVDTGHTLSLQPQRPQQSIQSQKSEPDKPSHPRFRNQGKNTISAMAGSYKSAVTKRCNEIGLSFGWQTRFHDHIIRDNEEFHRIKKYIINNPRNWAQDKFFKPDP